MSKRSSNLENLKAQKENIEEKILKLQIQLKGIEKSIAKAEAKATALQKDSTENEE